MPSPTAARTGRRSVSSPSTWEPRLGYSRGVRIGNQVFVAGTAAIDGEDRVHGDDAYTQTDFIIRKIQTALRELGADLEDVVSTVTYLSDRAHFDDYARAHRAYFQDIAPVNTTVLAALVRPDFLVEITATAVIAG
ncbi:RidA family protein [Sphaerisporangium rubeum]|uniref:Enamine deaminase RidA (YjgF/YER057c/UK114 family) n=1 Tax=Sphaerisporangium rubeum TaxID=321317 RepID=A0A7X0I9X6_9ACTN|nr:enamine deaminase RidA (YjgF/YER057c/UK114 family) [Sphaerisporangium rubeum]